MAATATPQLGVFALVQAVPATPDPTAPAPPTTGGVGFGSTQP